MRKLVLAAGVVVLTVAGCSGEPAPESEPATGSARPGSDLAAEAGSTEVEEPEPRLVVADAATGRVDVLDLATENALTSFDLETPSRLTTVNGRYVVANNGSAVVVDPGSWTIDHGDHSHSYVKEPAEIGTLDGDRPGRIVAGDRKVAVVYDGTADIVDFDSLAAGEASVATTVTADGGLVVPMSDHFVVSTENETLELRDDTGVFVRALDGSCPQMQGDAVFSSYFLLACADGVMKVASDFTTTKLPYPVDAQQVSSFDQQGRGAVVSGSTATGVLILDTRSGEWVHARTADETLASGMSSDGKTAFSLQKDGTFRVFDAVTGMETSSTAVLASPYVDGGTEPHLQVGGTRAYVTDPATNTVLEIDYRDAGRVARTFEFDFSPGSIGVVGS